MVVETVAVALWGGAIRSYRLAAVAISSMPQHAVPNGIGQSELRRDQLISFWSWVVNTPSAGSAASMPIVVTSALRRPGRFRPRWAAPPINGRKIGV